MYKIRKISFHAHPILGNLILDFCDLSGNACDTVIFAGENGTGKSTILNELYKLASYTVDFPIDVELQIGTHIISISYSWREGIGSRLYMYANDTNI